MHPTGIPKHALDDPQPSKTLLLFGIVSSLGSVVTGRDVVVVVVVVVVVDEGWAGVLKLLNNLYKFGEYEFF